jgi:hypothetical protein
MADNKVVLEFEIKGNGEQKAQSLRAQMKALKEELGRLPEGTKEFDQVQRQLGALTDKVGDLSKGVNTLAGDPLERLNNSFGMIGNSLMSLDFGAAVTGLNGVSSAVGDLKAKDIGNIFKDVGGAIANLGKALLTNPIFLVAGAVALIVMNFDKLLKIMPSVEKGLTGISETEREIARASEARAEASKRTYENIDKQSNILKLQGKTEKEILQYKLKALETAIADRKTQIKTQQEQAKIQIQTAERNRDILEGILIFVNAPLLAILKTIDVISAFTGSDTNLAGGLVDFMADFMIDPKEQKDELDKLILQNNDALMSMQNDYAGLQLSIQAMDKKTSENKNTSAKNDDKTQKESNEEELKTIQSRGLTRLKSERRTGLDLSKMSEHFAKSRAAMEIAIEENKRQTILEGEIALKNARLEIASQTIGGLMDLASAMSDFGLINAKKSFQINKALGIAQATISTYEGATAAFTTASKSPITIAFPGYPALMAGIAVTAGLAKIAKISATKFNPGSSSTPSAGGGGGGGGGGMGSGGGGSTSAPALDLSFLNNKKTSAQPIQSYVLATNVTSAQDAQQKIIDQSKLIK